MLTKSTQSDMSPSGWLMWHLWLPHSTAVTQTHGRNPFPQMLGLSPAHTELLGTGVLRKGQRFKSPQSSIKVIKHINAPQIMSRLNECKSRGMKPYGDGSKVWGKGVAHLPARPLAPQVTIPPAFQ